jgi:hypothetical protein
MKKQFNKVIVYILVEFNNTSPCIRMKYGKEILFFLSIAEKQAGKLPLP